jgi:hypothetical protein
MSATIITLPVQQAMPPDDNPTVTCPTCGFTAPLLDGFTLIAEADDIIECAECGAQID